MFVWGSPRPSPHNDCRPAGSDRVNARRVGPLTRDVSPHAAIRPNADRDGPSLTRCNPESASRPPRASLIQSILKGMTGNLVQP